MPAYYRASLSEFVQESNDSILAALVQGASIENIGQHFHAQTIAWQKQFEILKTAAVEIQAKYPESRAWGMLLEYPIPRRQKRIDAIILAGEIIIPLEFKVGAETFDAASKRQIEDYALDLRDFHEASFGRVIVPLLIATSASAAPESIDNRARQELVRTVIVSNAAGLGAAISQAYQKWHQPSSPPISVEGWNSAGYKPVPTIIEAAEALFAGHSVREIASSHADAFNLDETASKLVETVNWAQVNKRKVICFVTGVPGAGKTLAGLTLTHDPKLRSNDRPAGVFLSGNGPLVRVVRAALARDSRRRTGLSVGESKRQIDAFVQNVHSFIREYSDKPNTPPPDKVVVFDEAQRAWDAKKQKKEFKRDISEPSIMLSIMDRHPDWAVIIALVGGGQEIHDGEAGLEEWGRAVTKDFKHWRIAVSPEVLSGGVSLAGHRLFDGVQPDNVEVLTEPSFHLPVSVRTFKAENVSSWVAAVLDQKPTMATELFRTLGDFPVALTRSLESARMWLREHTRGERRCGLVASSSALRLRADGLELTGQFRRGYPYEEWFLAAEGDVRASFQLEVAATEFECQGLELDWVAVCWGGDLVVGPRFQWLFRYFHGTTWRSYRDDVKRRYLLNKYRVLLTRARQGFVIYVPHGDSYDGTREPALLDATANYLLSCGIPLFS